MTRRTLYLVTEPDGRTPVGLWDNRTDLGIYLRNYSGSGYRVFRAKAGGGVRPQEVAAAAITGRS